MSEKQKKGESRRMSETRGRKSREEIRREIRELITQQHRRSRLLAALAEGLGYRARRSRWTEGEMKRMRGMGGFAKALLKL